MLRVYVAALGLLLQAGALIAETSPKQVDPPEVTAGGVSTRVAAIAEVFQSRPGIEFQSEDIQQMQSDDFSNPGFLAVDQGAQAFGTPPDSSASDHSSPDHSSPDHSPPDKAAPENAAGAEKACADCHKSMVGVGASFPKINQRTGKLVTLTSQILECREQYQQQQSIAYESPLALALTTYIMSESAGMPFEPAESNLDQHIENGRAYYYQRRGQLNLACHHCHEQNAGRMLRGDLISEGVSTGYPIYRLEWQSVGSLHRRFRSCDIGVRAQPEIIGGAVYSELELYLRKRAGELPISSPAVRR